MFKRRFIAVAMLLTLPMVANGADVAAGKAKAVMRAACHGMDGVSKIPVYPNLKGQHEAYLLSSLKAFKNKSRTGGQSALMYPMVASLDDTDLANLAAYYSSLK
ncbi:c-type cytochrome [Spongorhabdus nitratireducens]